MITLELIPGTKVGFDGSEFVITRICDVSSVIIENGEGRIEKVSISKLELPASVSTFEKEVTTIKDKDWKIAQERFAVIQPILSSTNPRELIREVAKERGIGESTIYRWIGAYNKTKLVSSLAPSERTGGKGKSRLEPEIDKVIKKAIKDHYQTEQKKSIQKVCTEIMIECRNKGLEAPHYNTLRHRIAMISDYENVKYRLGKKEASKRFDPKVGHYPDALFPLSSVQIDHTPLDIIVVDELQRKPVGRPWLTLAIDTDTRMVVGLNITFEHPSAMCVGLCVTHAMLPKEEWLAQLDIFSEWPCWGVMKCIHVDNGKEFRSDMLKNACLEYNVEIDWRPAGTPRFGGIIERMLGTLSEEIHALKGTTFSNIEERGDYDSDANATMTLKELEQWLVHLIVDVYHNRFHDSIKMTPLAKWNEGLVGKPGDPEKLGVGLPPRVKNMRKVFLDFMPYEERTIQEYGVMIDNVCYYSDIFRRWINAVDPKSGKLKAKRKFKFKRDPRDISTVFFLDPEMKEYFPVPYRDTSKPAISIWEFKAARERVIESGLATVDEDAIFNAYKRMKEIEERSGVLTKRAKRLMSIKDRQVGHKAVIMASPVKTVNDQISEDTLDQEEVIKAFEDIDDGALN